LYGIGALYRLYPTADGWAFLAVTTSAEWRRLVASEDFHSLALDDRLADPASRDLNSDILIASLTTIFAAKSAAAWERQLRNRDIACVEVARGPVEANYLDDGSVGQLSGFVAECQHSTLDAIPRLAPLVRFSRSRTEARDPCAIGEHTEAILAELSYDNAAIEDLCRRGIVGTA
jgi:crotonobetainyl-CoA:carnitine CoA-transferase CaiB-like acyl-CoA transferase